MTPLYTRCALDPIFFEDLELGGQWTTRGRTITDADLASHAGVSGDFGPLHMDAQRAGAGQFGGRIAHGSLLVAVAFGLGAMDVPQASTVALVGTTWRFLKPVRPGATVHSVWRLSRKRDVTNAKWGLAVWHVELRDQAGERTLEGEVSVLVNRRDTSPVATRGRRRRRGRTTAPALPAGDANLPEPAPADTPTPAQRRRTPRPARTPVNVPVGLAPVTVTALGEAQASSAQPGAGQGQPTENSAAGAATPSAASRRRRRRRGGGGAANGAGSTPATTEGGAKSATPPPSAGESSAPAGTEIVTSRLAPDRQEAQERVEPAPRSTWAAPASVEARPAAEEASPLGRVLGRLRRPRGGAPSQK